MTDENKYQKKRTSDAHRKMGLILSFAFCQEPFYRMGRNYLNVCGDLSLKSKDGFEPIRGSSEV